MMFLIASQYIIMFLNELETYTNLSTLLMEETRRFNHRSPECNGNSSSLAITRKPEGIQAKCYRCGSWYKEASNTRRPVKQQTLHKHIVILPSDITTSINTWPLYARLLPLKYGLTEADLQRERIFYSPSEDRVIFTASQGFVTKLVNPVDTRPKYLSYGNPDFWAIDTNFGVGNLIVYEDKMSCVVGSKCLPSLNHLAIFGTNLQDVQLRLILTMLTRGGKIFNWLDDDNSIVVKQQFKIKHKLELYGYNVEILHYGDPKKFLMSTQI